MLKNFLSFAEKHIYITTAFLSLIISLILFFTRDIISRDAILYVWIAEAYTNDGLAAAFKVWSWPFYSIAIATVHKILSLDMEVSAYVLNMILEAVISVSFVMIYSKVTSRDKNRLWVAMLFILTFSTLNEYKGDIWRDYGFWAFTLMAIYHFITYYQTNKLSNALYWQLSIFIAMLFRVESIVYAALAPCYFLLLTHYSLAERVKKFFTLNSLFSSSAVLLLIAFFASSQVQNTILNNLPPQIIYMTPEHVFSQFILATDNFVKYVMPFDYSEDYSYLILASGLAALLIVKLFKNFTLVYSGIWIYGTYKKWINNKSEATIIYFFAAIALLILCVFISSKIFVITRYTVFLLLLGGLIFTQYLDYLISYLHQSKKIMWLTLFSLFIAIQFLDSLISLGAKKTPMKHSSEWLIQNINNPGKIACNEKRIAYYTKTDCLLDDKRFYNNYNNDDIQFLKENDYNHLILWVKKDEMRNSLEEEKNLKLLKSFSNKKNDMGMIFKIKQKQD